MLTILPSRDEQTVVIEVSGKAAEEDAEKMDQYVKRYFGEDEPFNVLAFISDLDGATLQGMIEGVKLDAKRWGQYNKFAVVSPQDILEKGTEIGDILPGIETKQFESDEVEEAWNWIEE
ncbi:STAS/SEC14 domain-containing protein [Bacillus marinisedimentorum]|uniref:STAS/SEC14 domain-containing protein n=1 Tax=Bacillus marinisedimentorum TaxID=1821260 RepID=UPI0008724410|nr:STAS/SEC14 domain-containing protein [Bacillus marinisedimentorum]